MNKNLALFGFAIAAAASALAAQTTVGITPSKDNTIFEENTNSNALGRIYIGRNSQGNARRGLLRFDVAGNVPANAIVIDAKLVLNVEQTTSQSSVATFAHRVTQDWGEGTSFSPGGGGAAATTDDATWLHSALPTNWTAPGGDFDAASWSFSLGAPGVVEVRSLPGLVDDVQDMLDDPANNFGWLLKTDEVAVQTARRISSRENASPPTLDVTYLLPGEVGRVGTGCNVGPAPFELDFVGPAISGQSVTLQRSVATSAIGYDFYSLFVDPIGTPLPSGCLIHLPTDQELVPGGMWTTTGGVTTATLAVPPGFPRVLVASQAAVLAPTPSGLSLSNAALMILQ